MKLTTPLIASALIISGCAATPGSNARSTAAAPACEIDVSPLTLPRPVYPAFAASNRVEDFCEARFDIDGHGDPFNVSVRCTYRDFADAAEAALMQVRFDPALARQLPAGQQCAKYPIAFEIEPEA